jgi:hypothetical protein
MEIWDILWPFGTFCIHLVHFSGFGITYQEQNLATLFHTLRLLVRLGKCAVGLVRFRRLQVRVPRFFVRKNCVNAPVSDGSRCTGANLTNQLRLYFTRSYIYYFVFFKFMYQFRRGDLTENLGWKFVLSVNSPRPVVTSEIWILKIVPICAIFCVANQNPTKKIQKFQQWRKKNSAENKLCTYVGLSLRDHGQI